MANTRYDEQRIDVESQVPRETAHHVDISGAKREFKELSRQLSGRYQKNPSTTGSEESSSGRDVEKGGVEEERFDLREYLTSSNDAHQQAGVKHKHVGVVWEDLQVEVIGGGGGENMKFYVRTFATDRGLDAILGFILIPFNLVLAYIIAPLLPKKKLPTVPIIH
ncbi:hypothetical protein BT96DRAFT_981201, partial [Gymnopus androsaceus JB14]